MFKEWGIHESFDENSQITKLQGKIFSMKGWNRVRGCNALISGYYWYSNLDIKTKHYLCVSHVTINSCHACVTVKLACTIANPG